MNRLTVAGARALKKPGMYRGGPVQARRRSVRMALLTGPGVRSRKAGDGIT